MLQDEAAVHLVHMAISISRRCIEWQGACFGSKSASKLLTASMMEYFGLMPCIAPFLVLCCSYYRGTLQDLDDVIARCLRL